MTERSSLEEFAGFTVATALWIAAFPYWYLVALVVSVAGMAHRGFGLPETILLSLVASAGSWLASYVCNEELKNMQKEHPEYWR